MKFLGANYMDDGRQTRCGKERPFRSRYPSAAVIAWRPARIAWGPPGSPAGGVERTRSTGSCALAGDRPVRAVGTPGCRSSDAAPPALGAPTNRSAPARRASSSAAARTDSADTVSNTPHSSLARSFAAWASRVALLTPTAQRRAARVGGFQPSALLAYIRRFSARAS